MTSKRRLRYGLECRLAMARGAPLSMASRTSEYIASKAASIRPPKARRYGLDNVAVIRHHARCGGLGRVSKVRAGQVLNRITLGQSIMTFRV